MAVVVEERVGLGDGNAQGSHRVVLCASPQAQGKSRAVAEACVEKIKCSYPNDTLSFISLAQANIAGCVGCNHCKKAGECVFNDDMNLLNSALDRTSELYVVSPVYFSGPPSQFKAMLDRLQPHYWKGTRYAPKRAASLFVVGEGGDPHGFEPLVTICRSALAVAGFELGEVRSFIGQNVEGLEASHG